jgi:hypothetical protein
VLIERRPIFIGAGKFERRRVTVVIGVALGANDVDGLVSLEVLDEEARDDELGANRKTNLLLNTATNKRIIL